MMADLLVILCTIGLALIVWRMHRRQRQFAKIEAHIDFMQRKLAELRQELFPLEMPVPECRTPAHPPPSRAEQLAATERASRFGSCPPPPPRGNTPKPSNT